MIGVEIANFQAIDYLSLEIEGFTALVGRSNIGKSSIVRALKCALSGSSGTDFIRHDARSCARLLTGAKTCKCLASVKLTFAEGQAVLWEKGGRGINRYTVWKDGVASIYDRVGQKMELPDFLEAQFAPVKLGPSDSLLQVSSQFDSPFLLDLSGPAVANVLSDIGQLDDINFALSAASKDRRAASSTRKTRELDATGLREELVRYEGLDAHLESVRQVQASGHRMTQLAQRFRQADQFITGITDAAQVARRLSLALRPVIPPSAALLQGAKRVTLARELLEGWESRSAALEALARPLSPILPSRVHLEERARHRDALLGFETALLERERQLQRFGKLTRVQVPSSNELRSKTTSLLAVSSWLRRLLSLRDSFVAGVRVQALAVPDLTPLTASFKRIAEVERLRAQEEKLRADVERTTALFEECTHEVESTLREFAELGLCPTCHQAISPKHVHHV